MSFKDVLQFWDTWKSAMRMKDRAFKNFKKWTPAYQENWRSGSSLSKRLLPC